ncbi:MAG: hypothetical protein QOG53_415 [Frankiales bacterium]|jgi:hypothetical protein|nr:hypothetical protein [Frankiales bacterium]
MQPLTGLLPDERRILPLRPRLLQRGNTLLGGSLLASELCELAALREVLLQWNGQRQQHRAKRNSQDASA